jgi:hypothetical protein
VAQHQQRAIHTLQHCDGILLEQPGEIAALLHRAVEQPVLFDDQNGRRPQNGNHEQIE